MNAIFTGRKRRGKTTLAFDMAVRMGGGVIVFDPKRELRGWMTTSDPLELEELVDRGESPVVFHPVGDTEQSFTPVAAFVMQLHNRAMELGWDRKGKCFTLIVDEAHQLQNSWRINDELKNILAQCRPEILNVFQTIQSPADAYRVTKVCNSDWYLFQTTHPADVKRIAEFAGEDIARAVAGLGETRAYIHYCEDDSSTEVVTDSQSWYRNLNTREESMAKKKITFDEESWSDFVKRLKKDLGIKTKEADRIDRNDDGDDDENDDDGDFIIVPPRRLAS